jgi:hypothetical protein
MSNSRKGNLKKKRPASGQSAGIKRSLYVAGPSLELLPHSVVVRIMSLLDVGSRMRMARVCKRFWELHGDEDVWETADLSPLYGVLDARKLRTLLNKYFPSSMKSLVIQHESHCSKQKNPLITGSIMTLLPDKCRNLTALFLVDVNLSQYTISDFLVFSLLQHLHFDLCILKHLFFVPLTKQGSGLQNLKELCLLNCSMVNPFDIEAICTTKGKNLRSLKLRYLYRLTLSSLKVIAKECVGLKELWLEKVGSFSDMSQLLEAAILPPDLTALSLKSSLEECTPEDLQLLSAAVPQLKHLDISGCDDLPENLQEVAQRAFPNLVQLIFK